jgi:DNA-binding LacI/PurR family transcriptional regulator
MARRSRSRRAAKVERAARELGYHPNALASSLTTGRTKLIGLISNNFHNPIFFEVFDLFTRGLQERGLRPLLVNLTDETDPQNSLRMVRQYSVDGVIVASSTLPSDFANAFRNAGMPVVHSFGRHTTSPMSMSSASTMSNAGAWRRATLIARLHRCSPFSAAPNRDLDAGPLHRLFHRTARHSGIKRATALPRPIPSMPGAMRWSGC